MCQVCDALSGTLDNSDDPKAYAAEQRAKLEELRKEKNQEIEEYFSRGGTPVAEQMEIRGKLKAKYDTLLASINRQEVQKIAFSEVKEIFLKAGLTPLVMGLYDEAEGSRLFWLDNTQKGPLGGFQKMGIGQWIQQECEKHAE